jgi:hypothetical protein
MVVPPQLPAPKLGPTTAKPPQKRAPSSDKIRKDRLARYATVIRGGTETVGQSLGQIGEMRQNPALVADGKVLVEASQALAEPLAEAIESTPALSKYFDRAVVASPWVAVTVVALSVAFACVRNHRPDLLAVPGGAGSGDAARHD